MISALACLAVAWGVVRMQRHALRRRQWELDGDAWAEETVAMLRGVQRELEEVVAGFHVCSRCRELGMLKSSVGLGPCPWHPEASTPVTGGAR